MTLLQAVSLQKRFGAIAALDDVSLALRRHEILAIVGESGSGKSTLLRALYGNYLVDGGSIEVRHRGEMVDITQAPPAEILALRQETLGYVSQFLRAMPRVSALDIVAAALLERGAAPEIARGKAAEMLARLNVAPQLHNLPPVTFSGGEQQRVNLARAFVCDWPVLLLDEPTASLDAANRDTVIALMNESKSRGAALTGIFHDRFVREAVADAELGLEPLKEDA